MSKLHLMQKIVKQCLYFLLQLVQFLIGLAAARYILPICTSVNWATQNYFTNFVMPTERLPVCILLLYLGSSSFCKFFLMF